jgi:hypothetical protein
MLSKILIFIFVFLGVFALFLALMPGELITSSFTPKYINKEVQETFDAMDVIMYDNAESGTIAYSDAPLEFAFGLPSGQYLEFDWATLYTEPIIYFRHLVAGVGGWWYDYHNLNLYDHDHVALQYTDKIVKQDLVDDWDSEKNASIFYAECPHIMTNVIFTPYNSSLTIGESWDYNSLNYSMSYSWNPNATAFSAMTILLQLFTFQSPDLGIPGIGGTIMNYLIAVPIWIMTAYLIAQFILALIPFIAGLREGG